MLSRCSFKWKWFRCDYFVFFLLWPWRHVKTSLRLDRRWWWGKWINSKINNKFQSYWISVKCSKMWSLSADVDMIEASLCLSRSADVFYFHSAGCVSSSRRLVSERLQLAGRRPVSSSWQRLKNSRRREAASRNNTVRIEAVGVDVSLLQVTLKQLYLLQHWSWSTCTEVTLCFRILLLDQIFSRWMNNEDDSDTCSSDDVSCSSLFFGSQIL